MRLIFEVLLSIGALKIKRKKRNKQAKLIEKEKNRSKNIERKGKLNKKKKIIGNGRKT